MQKKNELQTYMYTISLKEKRSFLFSNMKYPSHEC